MNSPFFDYVFLVCMHMYIATKKFFLNFALDLHTDLCLVLMEMVN